MILQAKEELSSGVTLCVLLTDNWMNNTIHDVEKIVKSKSNIVFPTDADRQKYLILMCTESDTIFFVADYRSLSFTRRLRCSIEVGKKCRSRMNNLYVLYHHGIPTLSEKDCIEEAGKIINDTYMTAIESIIREAIQ